MCTNVSSGLPLLSSSPAACWRSGEQLADLYGTVICVRLDKNLHDPVWPRVAAGESRPWRIRPRLYSRAPKTPAIKQYRRVKIGGNTVETFSTEHETKLDLLFEDLTSKTEKNQVFFSLACLVRLGFIWSCLVAPAEPGFPLFQLSRDGASETHACVSEWSISR